MSRAEYENAHGADPADLNQIKKFAQEFGLTVHETGTELARRTVLLSGTAANLQKAFNVELKEYSHPKGNFRGRTGAISVPAEYADIIKGVFGLDNRPQAEPHFRRLPQPAGKLKAHTATASHEPTCDRKVIVSEGVRRASLVSPPVSAITLYVVFAARCIFAPAESGNHMFSRSMICCPSTDSLSLLR